MFRSFRKGSRNNLSYTMKLFDGTKIPVLGRALDAYALRQKVIAGNLANITTPGYKAQSVKFDDELSGAMQPSSIPGMTTDARHMPIGAEADAGATPSVLTPPVGKQRGSGSGDGRTCKDPIAVQVCSPPDR